MPPESDDSRQHFSFFDFIVEFLGSLVPGVVFTTAAIFGVAWPFWAFLTTASQGKYAAALASLPGDVIKNAELGSFVTLLCVSYVLGHLFFRQDPNDPDRASFRRLREDLVAQRARAKESGRTKELLASQLQGDYGCETEEDVRFPYPYLHEYLTQRGLHHLMWFVLWKDPAKGSFRSKNYINVLKIRLGFYQPGHCITIARNEAHVRLISSTWHLCRGLFRAGAVGIAFVLIRFLFLKGSMPDRVQDSVALLACPVIVMSGAAYVRWKTEKPLHYMRLREIIFVLETAYTAFRDSPQLISDVFPEFAGSSTKIDRPPDTAAPVAKAHQPRYSTNSEN